MQSGCCKPPAYCGLQFENSTSWKMPEKGPAVPDPDCKTWSNNQTELCSNCESCKAAALSNIQKEWSMLAIANTCILICVTIIYSIGCCALRNNQSHRYSRYTNYYAWLYQLVLINHDITTLNRWKVLLRLACGWERERERELFGIWWYPFGTKLSCIHDNLVIFFIGLVIQSIDK